MSLPWWARQESNLQPTDYESAALPLSYGPRRMTITMMRSQTLSASRTTSFYYVAGGLSRKRHEGLRLKRNPDTTCYMFRIVGFRQVNPGAKKNYPPPSSLRRKRGFHPSSQPPGSGHNSLAVRGQGDQRSFATPCPDIGRLRLRRACGSLP